ncbi:hypothetical protein PBR20603_03613 [Pandoraea bronchicola]|uniref:Uncharacterized protein n=1 Tax=Pandoraea bronchicola TaxID=2508287 RepID=A0A5E5BTK0_9BURK|nr:hypothetical protein PBR20603_03613 [Pandoraea bronchicola]
MLNDTISAIGAAVPNEKWLTDITGFQIPCR